MYDWIKCLSLGAIWIFAIESTTATETLPKEDFVSFLNKGFSEFVEQFGKVKKDELGIEDLVEKQRLEEEQRLRLEQEAAETRRAEEAEQQRIRQETEQREKLEEINRLDSRIIETLTHFRSIQNSDLTLGELSQVLETMDGKYKVSTRKDETTACGYFWYTIRTRPDLLNEPLKRAMSYHPIPSSVVMMIKEELVEMMEAYSELKGVSHPQWVEFSG